MQIPDIEGFSKEEIVDWYENTIKYYKDDNGETTPFIRIQSDGYAIVACRLMFHWMIIKCTVGDYATGYVDRWCLPDRKEAEKAFNTWTGNGDLPEGIQWQRHPPTSRRRGYKDGKVIREWQEA